MNPLPSPGLHPPPPLAALLRWRWPALACLYGLLLVACGGGSSGAEDAPAVERTSLIGRVQTTDVLAGATVQVESIDARTGASQAAGAGTATETGLFTIPAELPHSAVRVTAQGIDAQGAPWGQLSAYTEAADPSQTVLQVNAVSTLVDRVRRLARLPLEQARAQVAASLELGAAISADSSFADVTVFDHAALRQAQVDSGLTMDAYLDRLAAQIVAEPEARHRFVRTMPEPAWEDPPRLQALPFAGDIAAAAAKAALNKAGGSDSQIGAVLASVGFGSDAKVLAQLQQINRKLDALQSAMANTQQMILEGNLKSRISRLEVHYAGKIRTAQNRLEEIAGYKNEHSRRQAAEEFNSIVKQLLSNTEVFSSALSGGSPDGSLADQFIELVWSDPSQKFYSWRHQERILAFLDYYDALNGALYLLYANYYRGLEVANPQKPEDFTENLNTKLEEFDDRRKHYLKKWPQRLDHERMFIGKTHRIVYSGVQGYGPADKRLEHLLQLRQGGTEWFMPTTKYYEQQHGISNATGQKVTQWLYRDFLEYAKGRNQAIGEAVVAAGAPENLKGTGKNAVFLLNEDLQEKVCDPIPMNGCDYQRLHTGYVVFDLANRSRRDYKVRRPTRYRDMPDMTKPVPGNYHYIYARELTAQDRLRWNIPATY